MNMRNVLFLLAIVVAAVLAVRPGEPLLNRNIGVGYNKAHTPMPSSYTTSAPIDGNWDHKKDGAYMQNLKKQLLSGLKRDKDLSKTKDVKELLRDRLGETASRDEYDKQWRKWGDGNYEKQMDKLDELKQKIRSFQAGRSRPTECVDCKFKNDKEVTITEDTFTEYVPVEQISKKKF